MNDQPTVGVAGAGTMGSGIAIVCARAGCRTVLFDVDAAALPKAGDQITAFLERSVERGRLTPERRDAVLAGLITTSRVDDLAACDYVIEAVFEDPRVKGDFLATANGVCRPETLFLSNTSTLSITELGGASGRPDRLVGMHFCLPAQVMKLVELTPGLLTTPESFERAWRFCEALGQTPVRTVDRPGFILNHFVIPFSNEAIRLVERGVAEPAEIDRAVRSALGHAMGPFELLDYVGMDTQARVCDALYAQTLDPPVACPPLIRRMIAAGHLGRKTGRGFYTYDRAGIFGA